MRSASWNQLFVIICLFVFARGVSAQDPNSPGSPKAEAPGNAGRSLDVGTSELGIWMGYSSDNPQLFGRATDRPYLQLAIQYARVLKTSDDWALKYIAEVVPVAMIKQPRRGEEVIGNKVEKVDLPGTEQKVYGFGITPVGLQMNFRRGSVLQPYIDVTGGVLYFSEQVPVADSSKFNFAFDFGAGLQIWYRENQSISLGYKYHHISNGYTARQNTGVDSDLFYAGCAWSWGR